MDFTGFTHGEVLMLLAHRSNKKASEVCKGLEINTSHLSRLYRSELVSENIRRRAAKFFGVSESVFLTGEGMPAMVAEPNASYGFAENITAAEVLRYLKEKDQTHAEERVLMLKIIDNLTLKK